MKVTDYMIVEGISRSDLVERVRNAIGSDWEILGVPQLAVGGDFWWQAMVRKFDPHAGKVFVRIPGKQGHWMDPEEAALARASQ